MKTVTPAAFNAHNASTLYRTSYKAPCQRLNRVAGHSDGLRAHSAIWGMPLVIQRAIPPICSSTLFMKVSTEDPQVKREMKQLWMPQTAATIAPPPLPHRFPHICLLLSLQKGGGMWTKVAAAPQISNALGQMGRSMITRQRRAPPPPPRQVHVVCAHAPPSTRSTSSPPLTCSPRSHT